MREIVAVDLGGTHARFALATTDAGRVISLGDVQTMRTSDHASLQTAWEAFAAQIGRPLPRAVAMAIACAVQGDVLKMTNNPWTIRPAHLDEMLGVDRKIIINDFEAVGHAVAQARPDQFAHICGPDRPLPERGTISIVGPGTGLGVAHVFCDGDDYRVNATEGGHGDFAPTDAIEDAILARLRRIHRRVSVERVVSGPAIVDIYQTLAEIERRPVRQLNDIEIWSEGLSGSDSLAVAAIDRFCMALGGAAGDIALVQGAKAVVIAGGLGARLAPVLVQSGFADRFRAKGRYESYMAAIPVRQITLEQPGLFGAAAAFARAYGD